jgi:RNA polymerase sigma-70 factor (sigma-E family)
MRGTERVSPGPGLASVDAPVSSRVRTTLDLRDAEREVEIARVFDTSHDKLVRLAVLLGAGADAEDVVAEAFCQLYRRWPKLRSPDAAPAYVRGSVVNLVRMRWRHLQVVRRHNDRRLPPAAFVSAESVVLGREDQRALVAALDRLAPRQREAIVLRYWMDLKEADIAAAMGISCGAVKSHTARAMAALTQAMEVSK